MANANLTNAKKAKNDEFYTQLTDIEKEMRHYKDFFKGKVVYCNCDDARESNFFKYFSLNFEHLGLKKLISTGFKADGKGVVLIYEGDKNGNRIVDDNEIIVNELEGNGDFRSAECIEYLKECDVVVTNPPFSLFREYVAQLMEYGKKFLIIGEQNALTYKDAGEKLTDQELLNINYTGSWLSDAKKKFSKTNCVAVKKGDKYVKGSAIRQELLELSLEWICVYKGIKDIAKYMADHQHDANANELWLHFSKVIDWVESLFPKYRKEMKGLDWGRLYAEFGENTYNVEELEQKISALMADEDVTSNKGVYEYVLSNCTREKVLSVRAFSDKDKRTKYEQQNGICPICGNHFEIEEMQGDHIVEWVNGGRTTLDNLQMVCHSCHKELTNTMRD